MKAKKTKLFAAISVFTLGVAAVAGLAAAGGLSALFRSQADATHSMTITAADMEVVGGTGRISVGIYDQYDIENFTYETIDGVRYAVMDSTSSFEAVYASGLMANDNNMRGAGYTGIVLKNKICNVGSGMTLYDADKTQLEYFGVGAETGLDHTINFPAQDDEIATFKYGNIGAGENLYVKFSAIQVNYTCESADPQLKVNRADKTLVSLANGETASLVVKAKNIAGKSPTFVWTSSDDDMATVSGDASGATVTAHSKTGDVTITCTMTVAGKDYVDTVDYTITAAAAEVIKMNSISGTKTEGAQIFMHVDPSSASITQANLAGMTLVVEEDNANVSINNTPSLHVGYSQTDTDATIYITFNSAAFGSGTYCVTATFKDNVNNKHYVANAYFKGTTYIGNDPLYIEGEEVLGTNVVSSTYSAVYFGQEVVSTYAWSASNAIVTISGNTATATVSTGASEGESVITVTVNGTMTASFTITVVGSIPEETVVFGTNHRVLGDQLWVQVKNDFGVNGANASSYVSKSSVTFACTTEGHTALAADHFQTFESWEGDYVKLYVILTYGVPNDVVLNFTFTYRLDLSPTAIYTGTLTTAVTVG